MNLCESAKKGHICPDDLCHGSDVTLCGLDKEMLEEVNRACGEYDEPDYYDDYLA